MLPLNFESNKKKFNQTRTEKMNTSNQESNQYRMARKRFFCYGCNQEFNTMAQILEFGYGEVHCPQCNSDFVEERSEACQPSEPISVQIPMQMQA